YEKLPHKRVAMAIFKIDRYLKKRKILHGLFFNKLLFWNKPKYRVTAQYKRYCIYIGGLKSSEKSLHTMFYELKEASSKDRLELVINSHGGSVEEGRQFYNTIQEKFHNRTVAYLDNHGYSMGATLFCMASKRVIYPYSNLMFHNYKAGFGGKGGEITAKVEHADRLNTKFRHDIVVKQGFLTEEEFERLLIGQDYWMASEELCRRGVATHIIVDGEEIEAEEYLKTVV
ncbi:MAG: ATP-dependent Clp protease proteolytic subunit, partial [Epsilonproteobacteria bacterium]|nr:ATP-dependent Clp protease proteolytic subunit [Campylobacterota bacterium]